MPATTATPPQQRAGGDDHRARLLPTGTDRRWLVAIVVVGLALRVAWAAYATRQPVGLHDPAFYTIFASELAAGRGYQLPDGQPTAYYPIGYPAALAGAFWLAEAVGIQGGRMGVVVALNLLAAALSFVLVFAIGRRLFDRRVGLVAAAGMALMPNLVFHTGLALTETLFNTIALAAVLVVVATPWRGRSAVAVLAFGALVGLAALVRPPSLLFLPVLALVAWRADGGVGAAARSLALAAVAAAAVIAPWTIRNMVVMEAPTLISSNVGDNLCIGHNPDATGRFQIVPSCVEGFDHLRRPEYEVRRDEHGRGEALEYLREEPAAQVRLVALRALHTFRDDSDGLAAAESYGDDRFIGEPARTVLGVTANLAFFAALLLGVASVVVFRRRGGERGADRTFVVLAATSLAVTPLAFFGDPRFHVPVVPFLLVGAAATAVEVLDRRATRRA